MNQKPPPSPIFKKFPLKQKLDTIAASSSSALQTPRSESPTSDINGRPPVRFSTESLKDISPIRKKSSKKREVSTPDYSSDSNLIDSATSKSPSDADKVTKKKKKKIHVVSPLTGDKIYVSSEDLIKSKKSKTLSSASDAPELISSVENLRDSLDDDVIVPVEDQTEVLFVSDGKQYKPKDQATIKLEKEEIFQTAQQKKSHERFPDRYRRRRSKVFDFCIAIYAGACLFSMLLLPTKSMYSPTVPIVPVANCTTYPIPPPDVIGLKEGKAPLPLVHCTLAPSSQFGSSIPSGTFDQGYLVGFLLFYSPVAGNLNLLLQTLGVICFLATWGRTVAIIESPKRGINKIVYVTFGLLALISSLLSYVAVSLMAYVDTNLSLSQDGVYGTQNWFFNPKALMEPALMLDLDNWTMLNGLRGVTGILAYIFWSIVKECDIDPVTNNMKLANSSSTVKIVPT